MIKMEIMNKCKIGLSELDKLNQIKEIAESVLMEFMMEEGSITDKQIKISHIQPLMEKIQGDIAESVSVVLKDCGIEEIPIKDFKITINKYLDELFEEKFGDPDAREGTTITKQNINEYLKKEYGV